MPDDAKQISLDTARPLSIAVLAMGGQGGGVLVDWIVALAESQGWVAQSTSVPGVAQRTGATIYYVEMLPLPSGAARRPVLSLMPSPGGVDIAIGAELMEAGRAIQRGLVTASRTTLLASAHRAYAVQEKIAPGDGVGDGEAVYAAAQAAAKRFIAFDMAKEAEQAGSVISAVLFGALAASTALPFPRAAFEDTIRAAGVGVDASLRAFARGFDRTQESAGAAPQFVRPPKRRVELAPIGHAGFDALVTRAQDAFPVETHDMLGAGLRRVVDFQDLAYGEEYLARLNDVLAADRQARGAAHGFALTREAAKHLAVAMAYDDVIRVADLKTRASRFARLRAEVKAAPDQIVYMTEFMHPRMEEVAGSLPAWLGAWIEQRPALFRRLDGLVNRGRRVKTGSLSWFLALYLLAGLRRFRRGLLRHQRETAHREAWLGRVLAAAPRDYQLAVELVETRRLIKGYSDTHARGESKFARVMGAAARLQGRSDAADWVRRLREAALRDEEGVALAGALATVESFL